jgi:hypothetical protein
MPSCQNPYLHMQIVQFDESSEMEQICESC